MKKTILMVVLLCAGLEMGFAQQATFDEANTLLENNEFNQAMTLYRDIEQSGQISGALFLNMGITAVQLDSMGLAKYYFLKAADFETTYNRASEALEYVNNQFSRQSAMLPKLPWDRAVAWMNEGPTASGVFLIGFIITLLGLIVLILKWFDKLHFKRIMTVTISLITIGIVTTGLSFYADYVDQRYDEAVLISNSNRVLQSPNPESTLVSIAYEGYELTVDHWQSNEQENWLYIRLGNGQFGWIETEGVKIL